MSDNSTTEEPVTSYDLIAINGVASPDIQKGTLSIAPNQKYTEYEGEGDNKVIDVIGETRLKGSVSYSGLFQSQIQTIVGSFSTVSVMTIYNPFTGSQKTFTALIVLDEAPKIIHDGVANAWGFSFTFEEIDDAPEENNA